MEELTPPRQYISYDVIRATWLSKRIDPEARTVTLLATAVLAAGALLYIYDIAGVAHLMDASGAQVFGQHQYWRLWTTLFAHADFGHIASNSFLFFILGFFLNGYFGLRVFPLAAFFWGGITNIVSLWSYDPEMILVGASGIVYWMGGAWLALYFFLSKQKNFSQRLIRSFGVGLAIFMPAAAFEPRVSYRTHFVGFALGLAFGVYHYYRHRQHFLKAERHETVFEEVLPIEGVSSDL